MAWVAIPNLPGFEYDNNPADPAIATPNSGEHWLWTQQTAGIRTTAGGREIYTKCRRTRQDSTTVECGEISKTYWDANP